MGKTIYRQVLAATVLTLSFGTARAGVIIDVTQAGANVMVTASGSIDLTGLTFLTTDMGSTYSSEMTPSEAYIVVGTAFRIDEFTGASGPSSFGNGGLTVATSGSGDFISVLGEGFGSAPEIVTYHNYTSGTPISSMSEYDNTTISGLGLNPGTYTYTWGSGATDPSVTVQIVPEPASAVEAMFGAAALAAAYGWSCLRRAQRRLAAG
jgi:hypothetical protein